MKRVMLIGSELGQGGAERSISLLSQHLAEKYSVTLCILSGRNREKFYPTCNDVVFIDPPPAIHLPGKIRAWTYRLKKLRELKKRRKTDVSISFLEGPDYANIWTRNNEKTVLSIRGSKLHDGMIRGLSGYIRKNLLIPQLYNRADEIVCVTEALQQEMIRHFHIKPKLLRTIYNFYEERIILQKSNEPLSTEEQKIFSKPVIISSGRLFVQKEQDKLIRVFHQLRKTENVRLMLLGAGELKNSLVSLTQKLGLKLCDWEKESFQEADVYLMGYQENAFKFYQASHLFALASSWEGFPNVLAEALLCGVPVISTDCPTGPREILNLIPNTSEPTDVPLRNSVGSLMPLLTDLTEEVLQLWVQEISFRLNQERPAKTEFISWTDRFYSAAILDQWTQVIES